jgi:hypothetical protein
MVSVYVRRPVATALSSSAFAVSAFAPSFTMPSVASTFAPTCFPMAWCAIESRRQSIAMPIKNAAAAAMAATRISWKALLAAHPCRLIQGPVAGA